MRYLTISCALVLILVLGACGTAGTEEGAPLPGEEPAVEEPAVEEEPVEEEAAGETQQEEVPNVLRGTDLASYSVINTSEETLGNTEDLMVALEGCEVDYLVLKFGGFLGMGQQSHFLIPWEAVNISPEQEAYVTDVLTQESLAEAPTFQPDAWPDTSRPGWDAEVIDYWRSLGAAVDGEPAADESEEATEAEGDTEGEPADESEEVTETDEMTETAEAGEEIAVQIPESVRLNRLLEYTVRNPDGEELGSLQDLMINWREGCVAYAVLSFGGFLGMGDKWFAVPLNVLSLDPVEQTVVIDVNKEMLSVAPGFDKDNWPETANPEWDEEIRQYWDEWMQELQQQQVPAEEGLPGEGAAPGSEGEPVEP